jgi:hypothetical protein
MDYIVGNALRLVRRPVEIEPDEKYREIGIRSFGRGIFHKPPILGESLGRKRVFEIRPGELVFSNVFAWEGAVAISTRNEKGMIGSHRYMTYRVNREIADLEFLNYYFQSEAGLETIRLASPGSAGRNKTLGIEAFAAQTLSLPTVPEQKRIANLLDRAHARTIQLAASTDSRKNAISRVLPAAIDAVIEGHDSSSGEISSLASIVNDTVRPGDDARGAGEFVGLEHIAPHIGLKLSSRSVGDETGRKFRFEKGDVLYGYLRPYQNKVWQASHTGLCSVEQFVLRCDNPDYARYLSYVLRGRNVLEQTGTLTNNLQLPRLSSKALLGLEVPIVRPKSLKRALPLLDKLNADVVRAWQLARRANKLTSSIWPATLNAAFNGEL